MSRNARLSGGGAYRGKGCRSVEASRDEEEQVELLAAGSDLSDFDDDLAGAASAAASPLQRLPRLAAGAFAGACLVACGAVALLGNSGGSAVRAATPAAPLTVRALLESDAIVDIATKNLIAIHGESALVGASPEATEAVRSGVAEELRSVGEAIRETCPEAHRELDLLEISDQQKDAALAELRRFGDERVVGLTREVAEASRENLAAGGDGASLERRLSERLGAKAGELRQLSQELFPDGNVDIDLAASSSRGSELANWHPHLEVDFGDASASAAAARRLDDDSGAAAIASGTRVHAQALLESMRRQLGTKMPESPARMLSFFGPKPQQSSSNPWGPSSSQPQQPQQQQPTQWGSGSTGGSPQKQSFMTCLTSALPNPMKVSKCFMDNFGEVMSMAMNFMQGGHPAR